MARLVNSQTGVVVDVDDATAENLGSDWSEVDKAEKPEPKTRTRKSS